MIFNHENQSTKTKVNNKQESYVSVGEMTSQTVPSNWLKRPINDYARQSA